MAASAATKPGKKSPSKPKPSDEETAMGTPTVLSRRVFRIVIEELPPGGREDDASLQPRQEPPTPPIRKDRGASALETGFTVSVVPQASQAP